MRHLEYLTSGTHKFIETESRRLVAGIRGRDGELVFNWYRVSVLQDEKSSVDGWW